MSVRMDRGRSPRGRRRRFQTRTDFQIFAGSRRARAHRTGTRPSTRYTPRADGTRRHAMT
jgi:hypothetical protein